MRLELHARTELTLGVLRALSDSLRWTAAALAEPIDSSAAYVAHLVAPLTRAGWVRSTPGPTGGYELATDLGSVSLHDLIEVVEGPTDDGRCVMVDRPCVAPQPCALHHAWSSAREALVAELDSIPLKRLIEEQEVQP